MGTTTDLVVASKYLTGQGVHCWKGMLGYVTKQHREDHYQVEKHNVSGAAIEEGQAFYALNAASAGVKGKKPLNPTSLVQVRTMGHWHVRCRVRRCIWVSLDRPPIVASAASTNQPALRPPCPLYVGRLYCSSGPAGNRTVPSHAANPTCMRRSLAAVLSAGGPAPQLCTAASPTHLQSPCFQQPLLSCL